MLGAAASLDSGYNGVDPSDVVLANRAVPNVAPIITLPGAQTVFEDAELEFSVATGNAIAIADADAGSNPLRLLIEAGSGTLTLQTLSGLTVVSGGDGTGSMIVDGSMSAINAALNGLVFRPSVEFSGLATLSIGTSDRGNTGTGGAQGASGTVNITVSPVNDAPSITANTLEIDESGAVVLTSANLNSTDPDNTAAQLTYTISNLQNGQFEFVDSPGVAITSFTQAQVDAGQVRFVHNGSNEAPSYDVSVSDGSSSDGPQAASITFTRFGEAPIAVLPGDGAEEEGATPEPSPESVEVPDVATPSPEDQVPSGVARAALGVSGPYSAPSQEANTEAEGSESVPEGQAAAETSAAPAPTPGEAVRVEATRGIPVVTQSTPAPGIAGLRWWGPSDPVATGMQEPPPVAGQDDRAEVPGSDASGVEAIEQTLKAGGLVGELDRLREDVERKLKIEHTVIGSTVALSTGLSVGYVVWLLRGGLLLTSLLSSLPAWHIVDPWPVLGRVKRADEEEDDSASDDQVEHMFDKAKTLFARLRRTTVGGGDRSKASGPPSRPSDDSTAGDG
jgi:hypothetical protein